MVRIQVLTTYEVFTIKIEKKNCSKLTTIKTPYEFVIIYYKIVKYAINLLCDGIERF